ncbi:hypothetical protein LCGC14_2847600 [marine sediment metagenome]|uniref:Uncharacterized protein n=1 Tax=marine sediment metagenome TaxID=412755 RepID=A0A0F9B0C7_9ZZZZ
MEKLLESLSLVFNGVGVSKKGIVWDCVIQKGWETIVIASADSVAELKTTVEELTVKELIKEINYE